jgi:PAS domain S-box-containing protein
VTSWQFTPYALAVFGAALLCGAVALRAWRRQMPGANTLALLMLAAFVGSAGYTLELLGADLTVKVFWAKAQYLGLTAAPVAWLTLALQLSGREEGLTRRKLVGLSIVPLLTLLLVFTNERHALLWSATRLDSTGPFLALQLTHGPAFWLFVAYAYAFFALGAAFIVRTALRWPRQYGWQTAIVLAGSLLPWIGNVVDLTGVSPLPQLSLTPFASALGGLIFAWGLSRFQLFDIAPVARDTLVESLLDPVLVLDDQQRVIDVNPAAQRLLDVRGQGRSAAEALARHPGLLAGLRHETGTHIEIALQTADGPRDYELRFSPLHDRSGRRRGWLVVLHDITQRRLAETALQRRDAILQALARISEELLISDADDSSTSILDGVLPNVLAQLGRAADVSRAYIFQRHRSSEGVLLTSQRHEWVAPGQISHLNNPYPQNFDYHAEGFERWAEFLQTGRPVFGLSREFPDRERAVLASQTVLSVLVVPIFCQGKWWGALGFDECATERAWSSVEIEALKSAASELGAALTRAAHEAAEREHNRYVMLLHDIARVAIEARDFQTLLQSLADCLRELFDADHCFLNLWDELQHRPIPRAASGPFRDEFARASPQPGELTMTASVLSAGHVLIAEEALASPYLSASIAQKFSVRSAMALPLLASGRSLGSAIVAFSQPHAFTAKEVERGEQAAKQAALAVAQAQLFRATAEEHGRLQAVIESSRDGLFLIGLDRRLLIVNAPALQLLRLPGHPDEWIGRPFRQALGLIRQQTPEVTRPILTEMRRVQRGDEAPGEGHFVLPPRNVHWLSLPVMAGEAPLGRLIVLRDVTQDYQIAEMRKDLTHMMVHDLRSPLGTISTALEFLHTDVAGQLGPDQDQTLTIARESTALTLELVNSILDVSRLESGQVVLERMSVALPELVAQTLHLQSPMAAARELRLESHVPEGLPAVWADGELIGRVLQNLVGNAIKFTPAGGLIRIAALIENSERPHVVTTVSDTGPGLLPNIQARLFQKFVSGQPSHGRRGSGLGLAFCKLVVEAHGGRIWVENRPGRGATFIFTLPIALPASEIMTYNIDRQSSPGC